MKSVTFEHLKQYMSEHQTEEPYYEQDPYTSYQNFLYRRALFGLSVYSVDEIKVMNSRKKMRIYKVHLRCQRILNIWKQQLINDFTNRLLERIFPGSENIKIFTEEFRDATDPEFINEIPFKDLGITKERIIEKLIKEKVLPFNFHSLKEQK